jgi:HSP90 family molecular chaperone
MDEEYDEFYKALTNVYQKHLLVEYFITECDVGFIVLLFVSKYVPYDLFEPKKKFKNKALCSMCFCHEQLK